MKRGVLVFDLCSSTEIIEYLHMEGKIEKYTNLFYLINSFIDKIYSKFAIHKYKYLGDGFILLIENIISIEKIIYLSKILSDFCNKALEELVDEELSFIPKRKGFTFGFDIGEISTVKIGDKIEYAGKSINLACRLQSSLNKDNEINNLMISFNARNNIKDSEIKKIVNRSEKQRTFRNIMGERPIRCFSIDLDKILLDKNKFETFETQYPIRSVIDNKLNLAYLKESKDKKINEIINSIEYL